MTARSALVLAGGRSTRFGEADKALAEVAGTPMVRRVADRLGAVADDLVVSCRRDQRPDVESALAGLQYRVAVDPVPDRGPIVGLRAGLRAARGSAVAVAACDVPRTDPTLFEALFDARGGSDVSRSATAVARAEGHVQPFHGVYHRATTRRAVEHTLGAGSRRFQDVVDRVDPVVVDVEDLDDVDASALVDVDRPSDLPVVTGDRPAP